MSFLSPLSLLLATLAATIVVRFSRSYRTLASHLTDLAVVSVPSPTGPQ